LPLALAPRGKYTYFTLRRGTPIGALARSKAEYLAALRWRRSVEKELVEIGLTFTQWLVLEATHGVILETGDAVNQNDVSQRAEVDRMTVSQVMRTLAKKGFVDRGPDLSGRGYRILLTRTGRNILKQGTALARAATSRHADV
jgi:DNA-binding MarR family transcriptional regulator